MKANRDVWDQWAAHHAREELGLYRIKEFKAGGSSLHELEIEELGPDVPGKSLLHLQCHFGLDTLSWLRHGASHVTGVDFSPRAIALARALAAEVGLADCASFIESSIGDLPEHLSEQFDVVYTSYGVLCWLPDLTHWGQTIARFLKPGGIFFIAEYHPFSYILDDEASSFQIRYPYFTAEPLQEWPVQGSYADPDADITGFTYEWMHTLGEVVSAVAQAGLRIEYLHEFDYTNYQALPYVEQAGDRMYRLQQHRESIPLMFSMRACKP